MKGTFYLIPCPITDGKDDSVIPLGTASFALRCKYFLVENVKQARRYLKTLDRDVDIDSFTFYAMGKHAEIEEMTQAILRLQEGYDLGMISDAGCPAVADPGWEAVQRAQEMGITVKPLVGPNSILLTLMASGLNGQQFSFHGYLPIDKKERSHALKSMGQDSQRTGITHLFMDTPFRNERLFNDVLDNCSSELRLCLAQDVTGTEEWIKTKSILDWKKSKPTFKKLPMMMALGH